MVCLLRRDGLKAVPYDYDTTANRRGTAASPLPWIASSWPV